MGVGVGGFFDMNLCCWFGGSIKLSHSKVFKPLCASFLSKVTLTFQSGKTTFGPEFQKCPNFFRPKL